MVAIGAGLGVKNPYLTDQIFDLEQGAQVGET
jgi:hypothetical protein